MTDASTRPILHADFISLSPTTTPADREALIAEAGRLSAFDEVLSVVVIEAEQSSDFDLAFLFVLRDLAALEPFGTDERYVRFLQGTVAPVLQGLAGADVQLEAAFPNVATYGACLALAAPPETYDWEVRSLLGDWANAFPASALGLAIGERQRFRGLAVAFGPNALTPDRPDQGRFGAMLVAGKARALT
jgi:hypothetical protein